LIEMSLMFMRKIKKAKLFYRVQLGTRL